MIRVHKMLVLIPASVAVLGLGWFAWTRWTPVLRYRAHRNMAVMHGVVNGYLAGSQPLEVAAHRLATLMTTAASKFPDQWDERSDWPSPPPGVGTLYSLTALFTPPGVHADARVNELVSRAMDIASEQWQQSHEPHDPMP